MKIRTGFVSYRSSLSFCIFGAELKNDEFNELQNKLSKDSLLEFHEYSYFSYYIGRSYSSIKDDETGKQFKDSTRKAISDLLGRVVAIEYHSEAWYDG